MRCVNSAKILASAAALMGLSACETIAEETNEAIGFEYVAALAPAVGGVGSGKAEISLNDMSNVICTDLELSSNVAVTAAHLMGGNNTVVATLDRPGDNDSEDCDTVSDGVIDNIKANPSNYRVHVSATTGDLMGTLVKEN